MSGRRTSPSGVSGFGFEPALSAYHFVVRPLPDGGVIALERFPPDEDSETSHEEEKVRFEAKLWSRLAESVAQEFNGRLSAERKRLGRWLKTETPLAASFGKELVVLGWAVEQADLSTLPAMLANWQGLAPEERWWFYTTINASTGIESGWRAAIKVAFAGNPVHIAPSSLLSGETRQSPGRPRRAPGTGNKRLPTFSDATQGRLIPLDLGKPEPPSE